MVVNRLLPLGETVVDDRRLGRHIEHDIRSADYPILVDLSQPLKSVVHDRKIGILNQGDTSACTGNAGTGLLGTEPFYSTLSAAIQASLDEKFAIQLYSDATVVDGFPGTYPPDDTGSSGLAIGKVLKKRGEIKSYRHTFGLLHFLQALMKVPLIIGIPWYSSFDEPGPNGYVKLDQNSPIRGGHEVEVLAADITNPDPNSPAGRVRIPNSWGTSYGDQGYIEMDVVDLGFLFAHQGDAMSFTVN